MNTLLFTRQFLHPDFGRHLYEASRPRGSTYLTDVYLFGTMVDNNNTVSVTMDVLRQDTRDNTSSSTRGSNCRTPSKVAFEVPGLTSCEPDIDGNIRFYAHLNSISPIILWKDILGGIMSLPNTF